MIELSAFESSPRWSEVYGSVSYFAKHAHNQSPFFNFAIEETIIIDYVRLAGQNHECLWLAATPQFNISNVKRPRFRIVLGFICLGRCGEMEGQGLINRFDLQIPPSPSLSNGTVAAETARAQLQEIH